MPMIDAWIGAHPLVLVLAIAVGLVLEYRRTG